MYFLSRDNLVFQDNLVSQDNFVQSGDPKVLFCVACHASAQTKPMTTVMTSVVFLLTDLTGDD